MTAREILEKLYCKDCMDRTVENCCACFVDKKTSEAETALENLYKERIVREFVERVKKETVEDETRDRYIYQEDIDRIAKAYLGEREGE